MPGTIDPDAVDDPDAMDTDEPGHAQQSPRPKIPRKAIALAVLLGLLTPVAYAWYFLPPDVIAEPTHFHRDDSGALVPDENSSGDGSRLKAQLGRLKARNNTVMVSSETHSNPAFLAASRLLIVNESDHLLIARVATSLLNQLKDDSQFSEIDYFPHGELPETGKVAPDLYLMLDLKSIDESGLIGRDLKAQVIAHFGTTLADSNYNVHDDQSPPTVGMSADIEVDHESSLLGVESSAAAYTQQGDDIAKQISGHLLGKLKDLREKHSPLPEMPTSLYPGWAPAPDFAFLDQLHASRLTGVHGLMLRNESLWEYEPLDDPITTVTRIRDTLLADGWTENNFYTKSEEHFSLQMSKGDATFNVFPEKESSRVRLQPTVSGDGDEAAASPPLKHFVRYRDRQAHAEIRTVVDELFAADPPDIPILLAMQKNWQGDQHSRAIQLIEDSGVRSTNAWLLVAESYSKRKDIEGTRRALDCCRFLARTLTDAGDVDRRIKKIAQKHKIDMGKPGVPDEGLLKKLGFVALDPEAASAVTVRFGEPAACYVMDDDGQAAVFTYTIDRLAGDNRFRVVALESTGTTRSWSTQEMSSLNHLHSFGHRGMRISARVEETTSDKLTIRISLDARNART